MARSGVIDRAIPVFWVQKDTVAVRILYQADSISDLAGKLLLKLTKAVFHSDGGSNLNDLLFGDPNEASFRSRAAISALRAFERKPLGIPRKLRRGIF